MGTYLKFADPLMTRFNNAEYLSFLRRFRALHFRSRVATDPKSKALASMNRTVSLHWAFRPLN